MMNRSGCSKNDHTSCPEPPLQHSMETRAAKVPADPSPQVSLCEQAGIPAAAAPEYAVKQWATCSVFPNATHTEFCDWALRVQHVPAPYTQLDLSLAASLLGSFRGNISQYTATCVWLLVCVLRWQAAGHSIRRQVPGDGCTGSVIASLWGSILGSRKCMGRFCCACLRPPPGRMISAQQAWNEHGRLGALV